MSRDKLSGDTLSTGSFERHIRSIRVTPKANTNKAGEDKEVFFIEEDGVVGIN